MVIRLKTAFGEDVLLDHGHFTVPESPVLEKLLNTMAKVHPVLNGGSPDPDFDLLQNLRDKAPTLEIISNDCMGRGFPEEDDGDGHVDEKGRQRIY
jgi:hypothetical protein